MAHRGKPIDRQARRRRTIRQSLRFSAGFQQSVDISAERIGFFILTYPIFLAALTLHEFAHAITARWGGDMTSSYQGRVTLNPIAHMDPIGTVLMPVLMAFSSSPFLLGWAKPVPIMNANFRRGRGFGVIVALAGPFSNLLQAIFFAICLQAVRLMPAELLAGGEDSAMGHFLQFLSYGVILNLILAIFNMMPVPPLDGSHVLWHTFMQHQPKLREIYASMYQYGFMILVVLSVLGVLGWWIGIFFPPLSLAMDQVISLPDYFRS